MQNRLLEALMLLIPSGLLTTLVYLYLNAGKPTKQVRHIILVNCCPEILQNLMQGGETILLMNFFSWQQMALPSVSVSFQVLAKNHLI